MKKILLSSAIALMFSSVIFAEKETIYISPNNDGTQDFLEVPIQIKDKRYIKEWKFFIENENGEIVRTIENKDKRDSKITFKSFFKALISQKDSVDIPKTVLWNGVMDNGEIAPDGNYKYYMKAKDDNGNTAMTEKLQVVVDNTPPQINLTQPSQDGKIFGEGDKVLFAINQKGSNEDLWTGVFCDARGNPVKTIKWTSSEPLTFDWNGTDDAGLPLSDGIYSYKVSAVDRAGNKSEPATISNIIYSAEKPTTNITLSDGKYLNPKLEGMNEISFDVKIPIPNEKSGNKLVSWSVQIIDEKENVIKTISGTDNPPEKIAWNGKNDSGNSIADSNSLQAKVNAKYLNGFETEPTKSPTFVLDTQPPKIKVAIKNKTFSPDGDGNLDSLEITQTIEKEEIGSPVENWEGKLINAKGEIVKKFNFGSYPPENFTWDGFNDKNEIAEDGTYKYELFAMDKAGNSTTVDETDIKLDTSKTEIIISLNKTAFNPKRPADIKIVPVIKTSSKITDYDIFILSEDGTKVWSQKGSFLPTSFTWNGVDENSNEICKDGNYIVQLSTKSENGSQSSVKSQNFEIDTIAPKINLICDSTIFSPDGDGKKDSLPIKTESTPEENWIARVYNDKNESVKTYTWKGSVDSFNFDGTDSNGNVLQDGNYSIVFSSEDKAGNKGSQTIPNIIVDNRETKAYVTVEEQAFSPNDDKMFDTQKFTIKPSLLDGIESWKFEIVTPEGKIVKSWTNETMEKLPSEINWDGKGNDGNVVEDNIYSAKLNINYAKGNIVETISSAFISCITPPNASVKTSPIYFSPDNDGEDDDLFIQLKANTIVPLKNWSFQINDPTGKKFWSTNGTSSITEQIMWDGRSNSGELVQSAMDYPYTFTVTDSLGMTSTIEGIIPIDILVVRENGKLKMAVPSIIFRSDAADFKAEGEKGVAKGKGLTKEQIANNERVLKRIAVVLNKFKNYKVTIEGHGNRHTNDEKEETVEGFFGRALIPLSKERAEVIKSKLKSYGVDGNRLSTVGMGGTRPIANRSDDNVNWKNRRVEFILDKNK